MNEIKNNLKAIKDFFSNIFNVEYWIKHVYLLALVVALAILVVENRYACDKQIRQIEKLKSELLDKKNDALAINAELSQLSRQSNVKTMILESGVDVAESTLPPFIIKK